MFDFFWIGAIRRVFFMFMADCLKRDEIEYLLKFRDLPHGLLLT
jgi:hypothetical protein